MQEEFVVNAPIAAAMLGKALGVSHMVGVEACEISIDCFGAARKLALIGTRPWGWGAFVGERGTVGFDVSLLIIHPKITLLGSWLASVQHMERLPEKPSRPASRANRRVGRTRSPMPDNRARSPLFYNKKFLLFVGTLLSLFFGSLSAAHADVALNGVFADHMVLQRGTHVPVWGTAAPGEAIRVRLAEKESKTNADGLGRWRVTLENLPSGGPYTLTINGATQQVTCRDVLVGDVWLCSGQSNMAYTMSALKNKPEYASDLQSADFPTIRQGLVPRHPSVPLTGDTPVAWTACTPRTVADFTATGFYFARELQKTEKVPIGLLHASWGGTSAESWVSTDALHTVPDFKVRADAQQANLAVLPERIKGFPAAIAEWEQKYNRTDVQNTGEAAGWSKPDFDDSLWHPSTVNTKWADVGIPSGGVIWMRKTVDLTAASITASAASPKGLHLDFAPIDEQRTTIYFNGVKVGESGRTPPGYYADYVRVDIPTALLRVGQNVLAVRYVAAWGNRAPTTRKADALGFRAIGITGLKDECRIKTEREFAPLTKEALAERPPAPTGDAAHTSGALFGGMIYPLIPFAIKGVLWYQGEQDVGRAHAYRTLLPLLIRDWRSRWGQGDFPFLIQQLPNFGPPQNAPEESEWAEMREAQAHTAQSLPNCGLSVALDIGDAFDVHPSNKRDVGIRLAWVALAQVYHHSVTPFGPVYQSHTVENGTIHLRFIHTEGLCSANGEPLHRFAIAGKDRRWVWADARIDGADRVIVSSPDVPQPVAVRYAWAGTPEGGNLTNRSGLPAAPFRTDTWPGLTDKRK